MTTFCNTSRSQGTGEVSSKRTMVTTKLAQVEILLHTKRFKDAETTLREALVADPDSAYAHGLLSFTLYQLDRNVEALREAEAAIALAPNDASNYYYQALALLALQRLRSAMSAIEEAIRLNPENARYHAVVSRIHAKKKSWQKALDAATEGLCLDPENVQCANLHGLALVNLGRKDEASQTIAAALARDPENALTHANQGWALLHTGDHEQAFTHFREALRLNPLLDWARSGIVEALKARNPVYRLMLRYFLWMSRLTNAEQWQTVAIVAGAWRALRTIARQIPLLYVIVFPLSLIYSAFAVLTWTARPFFALVLRFDRLGRLALPKEEIVASNWVAACLLTAGGGLILSMAFWNAAFLVLSTAALAMILPIAAIFRCSPGTGRVILAICSVLLALAGLLAFALSLIGSWAIALALAPGALFILGWTIYPSVANLVILLTRD
jgi:tetratricopeptide (TPR) repeat protein